MGSYLDTYAAEGERSERRARLIKHVVTAALIAIVVGLAMYFWLRTRGQEKVVQQFLEDLRNKNYSSAYALWGCTPQTPCKDYPQDKFNEDWGASGLYRNATALKVEHVDYCDTGVVFGMSYPNQEAMGLWVDRSTNLISFAPWPRCPGRHLQFGAFFHSLFSGSNSSSPGREQ